MAEAPKYRPLGVSVATMPAINYAAAGQAQARVYDQLNRGLDSMFRFATEKATAQAKIEAAQFAFENPVTAEQLEIAVAEGRDISEIVGDQTTVFGGVTAASYATQLSTELNKELTKKISAYDAQISAGLFVDPDDMQKDLTAMIAGHGDLVAQIDPSAGLKYNASANASASVVYKAALEHKLKMNQAVLKDGAKAMMDALPNTVKNIFAIHKGDYVATMGLVANELSKTDGAIIATGDYAFVEAGRESLRDVVEQQQINVLTDIAMKSDTSMSDALTMGNFGTDHTDLFLNLDDAGKAKVREAIRTRRDAKINDDKVQRGLDLNDAKRDVERLSVVMADTVYQGPEFLQAVDELQVIAMQHPEAISQQSITSFIKALDPTEKTVPNYVGMFELKERVFQDKILTFDDLEKQGKELNVSPKDIYSIVPFLEASRKEEGSQVRAIIRRNTKIVDGSNPTPDQSKAYYKMDRRIEDDFEQAVRDWESGGGVGAKPTRIKIARQIDLEYRTDDAQKDVNAAVSTLVRSFSTEDATQVEINIRIDEDTTLQEIEDALRAMGFEGQEFQAYYNVAKNGMSRLTAAIENRDALR
jgi:hypothetical protein